MALDRSFETDDLDGASYRQWTLEDPVVRLTRSSARSSDGKSSIAATAAYDLDDSFHLVVDYCDFGFDLESKQVSLDVFFDGPSLDGSVGLHAYIREQNGMQEMRGLTGIANPDPETGRWLTYTSSAPNVSETTTTKLQTIQFVVVFGASWSGTIYIDNLRWQ